jgi:hypothetical protein
VEGGDERNSMYKGEEERKGGERRDGVNGNLTSPFCVCKNKTNGVVEEFFFITFH